MPRRWINPRNPLQIFAYFVESALILPQCVLIAVLDFVMNTSHQRHISALKQDIPSTLEKPILNYHQILQQDPSE